MNNIIYKLQSTNLSSCFILNKPGLGSRMAALRRPRQSSELYGETTFNPGQCPYQAAKHWECCAATPSDKNSHVIQKHLSNKNALNA